MSAAEYLSKINLKNSDNTSQRENNLPIKNRKHLLTAARYT